MNKDHLLSSYTFPVPVDKIAQQPVGKRECAKIYEKKGETYKESVFQEIHTLLPEGALVVLNETKVFSCRLETKNKTGGKIEIFLLENPLSKNSSTLEALVRPFKRVEKGMELSFSSGVMGTVLEKFNCDKLAKILIQFDLEPKDLDLWLAKEAKVPLPPYIKRDKGASEPKDLERYQTVYAKNKGSVAAPTAGLHFTDEVMEQLKSKGVDFAKVTLHVGLGTFLPIKDEEILQHKMHEESYRVPKESFDKIEKARAEGRKIIIVGTTSLRCVESFYLKAKQESLFAETLVDQWLKTDLFIHPRTDKSLYKVQVGDALLTNFHQPCSSLFVLISALIGRERALEMYQNALGKGYRFYSYGDATLLWL